MELFFLYFMYYCKAILTNCVGLSVILLYKVASFFVLLSAEPIWFFFTVKLLISPEMVLGYFICRNKPGFGFGLFICSSISL